jgi:tripartite-type tricarboxylate transporter receptor subunit TctC
MAVIASGLVAPVLAQTPGRTITIVVPYTPGSGPDILARLIGDELARRWGQPFVVDNKPGASGSIGSQMVARAAPDGHTLLVVSNPFTANVSLFKSVPYDPVASFAPIMQVASGALALTVHPSVPAGSARDFVAHLKGRPGALNYGTPGVGTPHHLAMELFRIMTGTELTHVPYRGAAGAVQDLIGGHVSAAFFAVHVAVPIAHNNQLRMLAVAGKERVPVAPDVPTLHEQGLAGFEVDLWYGALAPAGTPREIVLRYNTAINDILQSPRSADTLAKQGLTVVGGAPERLADFLAIDVAKWRAVVKEAGITAE